MGVAPNLLLQGVATGVEAFTTYKAGRAAEESYKDEAAEVIRQSQFSQREAIEAEREVVREGEQAKGTVAARAGKAGVRIAGSVKGQIKSIGTLVERRLEAINRVESENSRRALLQARQLKKQGRRLARAGKIGAIGTGLLGAADIGSQITEAGGFANIFRKREA
jgi:hypothetical protein